ncbi:MAG: CaiB/BaiF CoA transferase family protein [Acidimicrobiales bacterium]
MARPLEGIRIIDLTTVLSGPFATFHLALLGAEVIKVERPGVGDVSRDMGSAKALAEVGMGAPFLAQNGGKKSIVLDLKDPSDTEALERLLSEADVLVENMRPGVMERLGFSWGHVHALNPLLVYCSLTGFGQTGPDATRAAYDQIIQGLSGMTSVTGFADGDPVRTGFPICDTLTGYVAAMSVCAALVGRSQSGKGCHLDVSMLDSAITSMGWVVSEQLISDRSVSRMGNDNDASSPSGAFRTLDGMLVLASNTQEQFTAICRVLERPDILEDERFATRDDRRKHRRELTVEMETVLAQRSAEEWERLFAAANVPTGRVLDVKSALTQAQVRERGLVHEIPLELPGREMISVVGTGVRIDGEALSPLSPPPTLGQHSAEILGEYASWYDESAPLGALGAR